MGNVTRKTGIDALGDAPWGTHFCLLYQTQEDLIDILVPYFKAGLENSEFCMWVTSEPLPAGEATQSLRKAVPNLDDYMEAGQIEILDYTEWYTRAGVFEADRVLRGWVEKENEAVRRGFGGLRLAGNTSWLEKKDWKAFTDYEAVVDGILTKHPILALCAYSLAKCGASEVVDVVSNHEFTLLRQGGRWQVVQSAERKRAKDALRESDARYRSLFENMLDGFAYCQMLYEGGRPQDFIYLEVNGAFERLTGLGDVVGRKATEAIPGIREAHPELFEIYGRVALTGQPERFELYLEPLKAWLSISVYSTERGRFVAVFDNITERKRAEQLSELLTTILDTLNRQDADNAIGNILLAIKSVIGVEACAIRLKQEEDYPYYVANGFPAEFVKAESSLCARDSEGMLVADSQGQPVLECMCGNVLQGRVDPALAFFTPGGSFWTNSTTDLLAGTTEADRQGRTRNRCNTAGYESVALIPLKTDEGTIGLLQLNDHRRGCFARAMIEFFEHAGSSIGVALRRKRAEEEVRNLNAELEQRVRDRTAQLEAASKELESFAYSVSHDLRAPLRAMSGFSQLLAESHGAVLDEKGRHYLDRIGAASQTMDALIDDLLALSLVTRAAMQVAPVDLSLLAHEVVAALQQAEPERRVEVQIAQGVAAQGDRNLLRLALENLLGNAWKFTGSNPHARIEFGAVPDGRETTVHVRDNGVGFDMAYAGKLFVPFQRLHGVKEFPGTGIGLATVQRVVHRHGGRVWGEGKEGEGAAFFFSLPT